MLRFVNCLNEYTYIHAIIYFHLRIVRFTDRSITFFLRFSYFSLVSQQSERFILMHSVLAIQTSRHSELHVWYGMVWYGIVNVNLYSAIVTKSLMR